MSSAALITLDSTIVQSSDLLGSDINEGHILLSIESGKYYGVTAVGNRIWELSSQPITLRALCEKLMAEYEVERDLCEAQVLEFVTDMSKNGIVIVQS